jgi:sortase A
VEGLLFAIGLALLAAFVAARIDSYLGSRAALREFYAGSSSANAASPAPDSGSVTTMPELTRPAVDPNNWDRHRWQEYLQSAGDPSGKPIAVLRIAKLSLEVPVLEGTDDRTLNRGAGRIAGTAHPGEAGNIGIAAHRDGFFRKLKDVHVGDPIELVSLNETDTYIVDRIQIVTPDDVQVLEPRGIPSLTLVTCYPFYFIGEAPQRYIVTASLRERQGGSANTHADAGLESDSSRSVAFHNGRHS